MKRYIIFFLALFILGLANGQELSCKLYGEGNSDLVRLMWVPKSWPENLEGFVIMRRDFSNQSDEAWEVVNERPVEPYLELDKNLANVEKSSSERERLKQKLQQFIESGRASELNRQQYTEEVLNAQNGLSSMALSIAVDFDIALLNGFGLIDRNVPKAEKYEYGLFPKYENQALPDVPISTYLWDYGTTPDTSLDVESKIRKRGSKSRITVSWEADTDEMQEKRLVGFNIYKKEPDSEFRKVNDHLIFLSIKDNPAYLTYRDELPNDQSTYIYAASPVTMFGTEGERHEISYEPSKTSEPAVELKIDESIKDRIQLNWNYENDNSIDGFRIERKKGVGGSFDVISDQLSADTRSFTDTPESGYYFYRLGIVKDGVPQSVGNVASIYYEVSQVPDKPNGLSAEWVDTNGDGYIQLNWQSANDPSVAGYRLFSNKPTRNLMVQESIPLINGNSYRYEVGDYMRGNWSFAVAAVSQDEEQSPLSNTASVLVPSITIPAVFNRFINQQNSQAIITWNYPDDIDDLAGFRIFQDGQQMANESTLTSDVAEWTSQTLEPGLYNYEIMAVSQFGVESQRVRIQIEIE